MESDEDKLGLDLYLEYCFFPLSFQRTFLAKGQLNLIKKYRKVSLPNEHFGLCTAGPVLVGSRFSIRNP